MPIGLDVDFFSLGQQVEAGELQGVTSLQDTITQVQTSLDLDQDAVEAATQAANLNGGAYGGVPGVLALRSNRHRCKA